MDNQEAKPAAPVSPLREGAPAPAPPLPPPPEIETQADEAGFFSTSNLVMLGMIAALLGFLAYKFTVLELWAIVKAALGLSFVIFIHELGHFLAAKWCGVNVTTFSIGFGPAIPGCHFTWGETTYKLAILPLGGYVQMVGQVDGDEGVDDNDDPRSYRKKTVAQRMLIISAGVIMNAILAVFCFIAVYQGAGKENPSANVGSVDSDGPAAKHGVRTGSAITRIGSAENPTFPDLMQVVINTTAGEKIPLEYQRPGEAPVAIEIEPRKNAGDSKPVVGLTSPRKLIFMSKTEDREGPYLAGTPAAAAKFHYGDVVIGMSDPADPSKVTPLPDDPRYPGHGQCDFFEFARRIQLLMDKEIIIRVRRGAEGKKEEIDLKVAPQFRYDLGVRMQMGPIMAIRDKSPAEGVVRGPDLENKLEGDRIEAVSVVDADGQIVRWKSKDLEGSDRKLDPERLPIELRQWADSLDKKKATGPRKVTLTIRRHKLPAGNDQYETLTKDIVWDADYRFERVAPYSRNSPMPIPELGLGYQIKAIVDEVTAKDSPLKVGDVIKNVRYDIEEFKEDITGRFMKKDIDEGQWAYLSFTVFDQHTRFKKLILRVEREKKIEEIEIPLTVDKSWPLEDRGWLFAADTRRVKADNTLDAIWRGFKDTNNRMIEVFLNLRGMITGRIDADNIAGPLTIGFATYRFAGMGFTDFVFFLGLISINLAVVNFLPVPVLDGGHMVFLIYEKIRGQPASEAVRIWATYVGLAMILCLMIFVLYLDINRLFF